MADTSAADEINRTIRDLEEQIARYELTASTASDTVLTHSTPKYDRQTVNERDSGLGTLRQPRQPAGMPNVGSTPLLSGARTSVTFSTPVTQTVGDSTYDLSKYLLRNAQRSPVSAVQTGLYEQPPDRESGITFRKKNEQKTPQSTPDTDKTPQTPESVKSRSFFKPATYDGVSSWLDYKTQF